mgnify:CR=1 FL=1
MSEQIEGRNAVLEAFRSGKCVDKLFILDGCQDGPVRTIAREARKKDTIINYVAKERLDQLSETGAHQGVKSRYSAAIFYRILSYFPFALIHLSFWIRFFHRLSAELIYELKPYSVQNRMGLKCLRETKSV